jgi:NDP-sugar pyrophosphorylase family protein
MKAMVLAAGVGSRLRPITDRIPKALIEVGGRPMLEIVLRRLAAAGVDTAVVNLFHRSEQVEEFLRSRDFGLRVELSREETLLDTGGGLKNAARFLDDGEPFFIHNADIYSEIDLRAMARAHRESGALATLGARKRQGSRYFLFTPEGRLCGWESPAQKKVAWAGAPQAGAERLGFDCIHVASPALLEKMTETGVFSIKDVYLRLASAGEDIRAFRTDEWYWTDVGRPETLEALRARLG